MSLNPFGWEALQSDESKAENARELKEAQDSYDPTPSYEGGDTGPITTFDKIFYICLGIIVLVFACFLASL